MKIVRHGDGAVCPPCGFERGDSVCGAAGVLCVDERSTRWPKNKTDCMDVMCKQFSLEWFCIRDYLCVHLKFLVSFF